MTRSSAIALAFFLATSATVFANQDLTFVGKITDLKPASQNEVIVRGVLGASHVTNAFFIGNDFQGVVTSYGHKKKHVSDLKIAMQVQVTYRTGLLGRLYARKIVIVNGFNIPVAYPTKY